MCNLLSHRTNRTFFNALNNFDLVYFLLFLPTFTHLFTALWQKKTTPSRVVFLLSCGMGEEKPGASCRQASRFHLVGAACRPRIERAGFSFPGLQQKHLSTKANVSESGFLVCRQAWNTCEKADILPPKKQNPRSFRLGGIWRRGRDSNPR